MNEQALTTQATRPSADARTWATLTHLSAFSVFLGIPPAIGPLVMWLIKKDDPYLDRQGREALNFNLSFLLYGIAATVSILLLVGIFLLPAVFITWFVLVIIGTVKANNGEPYSYPFTIRFLV